jgi:hypothetical protein
MAQSRAPLHLGGPLGALGLGCVGGAVVLALVAINNEPLAEDAARAEPATAMTVDGPPPPSADRITSPAATETAALGSGGFALPGPGGDDQVLEAQGVPSEPAQRLARAEGTEVFFIVRLKGAEEVDIITRNFKRDPEAAAKAWNELIVRVPDLAGFSLAGASYSGEIKLAYRMPPGSAATPEEIRAVQDRLLRVEGVAYADPDYIAHPGKDSPP